MRCTVGVLSIPGAVILSPILKVESRGWGRVSVGVRVRVSVMLRVRVKVRPILKVGRRVGVQAGLVCGKLDATLDYSVVSSCL